MANTLYGKARNSQEYGFNCKFFPYKLSFGSFFLLSFPLVVFPFVLKLSDLFSPHTCHTIVERTNMFPWHLACYKCMVLRG